MEYVNMTTKSIGILLMSSSDRMHGTKHCNDFEDACSKLEDYVSSLAKQIQLQKDVQERLIQSEVYYEHQYGEAKIVANVSDLD